MSDSTTKRIAARLARARRDLGLTLTDAASQAGVSVAHLSRIERGDRQPSIGLLIELGRAYRMPLGQLVGEEPHEAVHVIKDGSALSYAGTGGTYTPLSGIVGQNQLTAIRFELEPHGTTNRNVHHAGEEWIYVLQGHVRLVQESEDLEMATGDVVHFEAQMPHHLRNATDEPATVLIVTAGTGGVNNNAHPA
ncbi:XRE family transcriptional regulator [Mycobacterium sp. 21AC1]|uniref:helix-turn-helix domain-containing protein n=1 Tax=[Mycobacterium] appelbergii TaxID=2939269 RepID=UPI00293906C7|nr:XRE family transcriptional regulator [Mycobacterium sp. 21AC1]MDV3125988.1 XRE family transcriptional regulator [Mycobacterium sp. 21AC1]